MPNDTYKPKHKKRRHPAASASRGPDRWARAAHNALIRPNSQEARLYQRRVALAVKFRDDYHTEDTPVVFMKREWHYSGPGEYKRDYVTCSLYCAAMQLQLEYGVHRIDEIVNYIVGSASVSVLDTSDLVRAMRCQCCGTMVQKEK